MEARRSDCPSRSDERPAPEMRMGFKDIAMALCVVTIGSGILTPYKES